MANAYQVAQSVVGQTVDFDGAFGGQCLSGEYLVKLYDNTYKEVKDLVVGDRLSTGNTVIENNPKLSKVYWLQTAQGWFKCTYDHKVFTNGGYKEVNQLTRKDEILLDLSNKHNDYNLTEDEWKFFGFWLGDGSVSYRWENSKIPSIRVTVGVERKYDYLDKLNLDYRISNHSNGKAKEYWLVNRNHLNLAKLIHKYNDKNILDEFTKEQYLYILDGYCTADGNIKNSGKSISSTNKQLLVTIQHGCHLNGISAKLSKKRQRLKTNYSNKPKPIWTLTVNSNKKFHNRFLSLEEIEEEETIYVLNTDGDHSYYADNHKHHNCADLAQYVGNAFGIVLNGNGNQIGTIGNVSAFADVIPWTYDTPLQVGDILSYDLPHLHPYGHVIVYGGGTVDDALVIEQNYNGVQVVVEHRRSIREGVPLRIVRFRNQDNYKPTSGNPSASGKKTNLRTFEFYEITCEKVEGLDGIGGNVVDTFFKCNKITGQLNGDWLIYNRYTGGKGYIPKSCVKSKSEYNKTKKDETNGEQINPYEKFSDVTTDGIKQENTQMVYSLEQFLVLGRIDWGGYQYTYYSQSVLNGGGLNIPGRHVNAHGYVSDGDGFIVLAAPSAWGNVKGQVYDTPFGYKGKVYDVNAGGNSLDVYIR